MQNDKENVIIQIIEEIKEEYNKSKDDFFIFLFNYFYPQIMTKSDSGDLNYKTNKYVCRCYFIPTEKKYARQQLEKLAGYLNISYSDCASFYTELDIYSMIIPDSCTDEEFGGKHISWYGAESDSYFESVRTNLALKDEFVRSKIEKEEIAPFVLITKIAALFK